jgi:hemin uptake protein HemP
MKPRTTILLLVVAVLALTGGWYYGPRTQGAAVTTMSSQPAFANLSQTIAQAAQVTIQHAGKTLVITRKGNAWGLQDHAGYPVEPAKLHALLTGLTEVRLLEPRTSDPAEFHRLGVEDPTAPPGGPTPRSTLLRVLDAQGHPLAELIVGISRDSGQPGEVPQFYFRRPGEHASWLAEGVVDTDADAQQWLDRDVLSIPENRVGSVTLVHGDQKIEITHQPGATNQDLLAVTTPADHPPLDQDKVQDVGHALDMLTLNDVKPAGAMAGQALGQSIYATKDGLTVTLALSKDGEKLWAHITAAGTGSATAEASRLNAKLGGWDYEIGDYRQHALLPTLDELKPAAPPASATPSSSPAPDATASPTHP